MVETPGQGGPPCSARSLCYTNERGRSLFWQVRSVVRWSQSVYLHCRSVQGEAGSDSPAVHHRCSSMHKALLRAQPSCSGLAHQTVLMSIYRSGGTTLGPAPSPKTSAELALLHQSPVLAQGVMEGKEFWGALPFPMACPWFPFSP